MNSSEEKPAPAPEEKKKPWPMSWVVIAVLVYAVFQMLVTLLTA